MKAILKEIDGILKAVRIVKGPHYKYHEDSDPGVGQFHQDLEAYFKVIEPLDIENVKSFKTKTGIIYWKGGYKGGGVKSGQKVEIELTDKRCRITKIF